MIVVALVTLDDPENKNLFGSYLNFLLGARILHDRIIGPYFLESIVKADDYSEMLRVFAFLEMKGLRQFSRAIFMHDGALSHWANQMKNFLRFNFVYCSIGKRNLSTGPLEVQI